MKKAFWWNPRIGVLSTSIVLFLLHLLLKELMSRHDIISSLFAAGEHLPLWMLVVTVICGLVRAGLFILVPSLLAWRFALWVFDFKSAFR